MRSNASSTSGQASSRPNSVGGAVIEEPHSGQKSASAGIEAWQLGQMMRPIASSASGQASSRSSSARGAAIEDAHSGHKVASSGIDAWQLGHMMRSSASFASGRTSWRLGSVERAVIEDPHSGQKTASAGIEVRQTGHTTFSRTVAGLAICGTSSAGATAGLAGAPQLEQNRDPGVSMAPHCQQVSPTGGEGGATSTAREPQRGQNPASSGSWI